MFPPRRANPHFKARDPDASVRSTDSDASHARISAVRKQYLHDLFISSMVPQPHLVPARPPLINIGTYLRSEAIDELVLGWLDYSIKDGKKVQVVSLGAGSDTRFWRLVTGPLSKNSHLNRSLARYLELDFSENTSLKVNAIQANKALSSVVGEFSASGSSLVSSTYAIHGVDLRNFQTLLPSLLAPSESGQGSNQSLLDSSLPTLVLAECVLVYMDQNQSDNLIKWFSKTFSVVAAIVYEMYGLGDSFGRVMKENLRSRNVHLPGVDAYPTLDAQCSRFRNNGFIDAKSISLKTIRSEFIHPTELARTLNVSKLLKYQSISKLEMLDEIEELDLVLDHYAITWALKASKLEISALRDWGLESKVLKHE